MAVCGCLRCPLENRRQTADMGLLSRRHHTELRQMSPQRIDRLRALTHQKITCAEQHRASLLLFPLQRHLTPRRRAFCLASERRRVPRPRLTRACIDAWCAAATGLPGRSAGSVILPPLARDPRAPCTAPWPGECRPRLKNRKRMSKGPKVLPRRQDRKSSLPA